MKRFFAFVVSLPSTFYSAVFYRNLVREGKGLGIAFLAVAALLNAVFVLTLVTRDFSPQNVRDFFSSLPDIAIEDGVLSTKTTSPTEVFLRLTKSQPVKIVLDMSIKPDDLTEISKRMREENIVVLAGPRQIYILTDPKVPLETKDYSGIQNNVITHDKWVATGESILSFFFPVIFVATFITRFVSHFLTALFGAVLFLLIAPLFGEKLKLDAALRLAAAAKVPVAAVFLFVTPHMGFAGLLWFGFASFGLLASRAKPVGKT